VQPIQHAEAKAEGVLQVSAGRILRQDAQIILQVCYLLFEIFLVWSVWQNVKASYLCMHLGCRLTHPLRQEGRHTVGMGGESIMREK